MPNRVPRWVEFEEEVATTVERYIGSMRLMVDPALAKVFRRKGYFSRDRGKEIIFDLSVEVTVPRSEMPSLIWLWECKDYPDRCVKVDELEEFHSKLTQVGAHKGTVVTRVGFDEGARAFSASKRIGLVLLRKEFEVVTCFEANLPTYTREVLRAVKWISSAGRIYEEGNIGLNLDDYVHLELMGLSFPTNGGRAWVTN